MKIFLIGPSCVYRMVMGFGLMVFVLRGFLLAGGNGTTSGEFLMMPVSARGVGMGGTGVSYLSGAESVSVNPASMGLGADRDIRLTHGSMGDSVSMDTLAYAQKTGGGGFGLAVRYQGWGSEMGRDVGNNEMEKITPNDLSLAGGYGHTFGFGSVGGAVKYVKSTLVETVSTVTGDLGYATPLFWGVHELRGGVAVNNLMGSLKYDKESSDLPRVVRFGADGLVVSSWRVAVEWSQPKGGDPYGGIGTEYVLARGVWDFAVRGGYTTESEDVSGTSGVSVGFGVKCGVLVVDYAYKPLGDLGDTHWITLGYKR